MQCRYLRLSIRTVLAPYVCSRTVSPANLVLWNDDLRAVRIVRTRDRVLEEANGTDDLALLDYANLASLGRLACAEVARVTDDLLGLDGLVAAADTNELAIAIGDDLVDGLVQHICTTVDGT